MDFLSERSPNLIVEVTAEELWNRTDLLEEKIAQGILNELFHEDV
jgi:hypothetical protein